jgi:glycosyltransferase involved in cell wall biosynthesis
MMISILTPSHNYGRFLPDAMHSVALQRDQLVEHIVVDNASTDNTVEILQNSTGVKYISEPDEGQSDALNKAMRLVSGDWCGWLNADEFYLPRSLEVLRTVVAQHPHADVVYGDCCFVDEAGKFVRLLPQHPFNRRVLYWYGPFISSCAAFFRASRLREFMWDVSLRRVMDWDLYLTLANDGASFVHVAHPIGAFRLHPSQVTAERQGAWSDEERRIRSRHGMSNNRLTSAALARVALVEHGFQKLVSGAYRRQSRASGRLRAADLRWFALTSIRSERELLSRLASISAEGVEAIA